MTTKPITPQEAANKPIPELVIECVNKLIIENYQSGYACFSQETLIKRIAALGVQYESWWLDFEPLYEKVGWKVTYDKPGYNESYPATFTFRAKAK